MCNFSKFFLGLLSFLDPVGQNPKRSDVVLPIKFGEIGGTAKGFRPTDAILTTFPHTPVSLMNRFMSGDRRFSQYSNNRRRPRYSLRQKQADFRPASKDRQESVEKPE